MNDSKPILLKYREAAELLSISPRLLWTYANRGDIPVVRVGNKGVRFRVSALEAWAAKRETIGPKSLDRYLDDE